jgi:hypothetical protein
MMKSYDDHHTSPNRRDFMATVRVSCLGFALVSVLALGTALEGCALFPLAALGGAALNAGGSAISKGTEYTMGGTAYRTFTSPIADVHGAIVAMFDRTGLHLDRDEGSDDARWLVGKAENRTVKIQLTPLTPTLTSMQLVVKQNILLKDRATAAELVEQTERALVDEPSAGEKSCCAEECRDADGAARIDEARRSAERRRPCVRSRRERQAECRPVALPRIRREL